MIATIVSGGLKAVVWGLAVVGLAGLVLAGLIASPVRQPPELTSISKTARAVDRSTMPGIDRYHARDGTELAYRHYPPRSPATGQLAIVVHGSSGSSVAVHALAKTLAERGVETFAPDMRGHGASGTRGDIAYLGQLEDDLSDFVGEIRKANPAAPLTLIGHSAGGGFALRVAGSPIQNLFVRTVLLAPYLGYDAPSSRHDAGGWASPVALFAGAADELMFPDRYRDAVGQRAPVRLIDGVNHMGIVSDPAAVSVIADEVVKAVSGS